MNLNRSTKKSFLKEWKNYFYNQSQQPNEEKRMSILRDGNRFEFQNMSCLWI